MSTDTTNKPLLTRPRKAEEMLDCGADYLYERLNTGEIESFRDGGARWIVVASIERYIAKRLADAKAERERRAANQPRIRGARGRMR